MTVRIEPTDESDRDRPDWGDVFEAVCDWIIAVLVILVAIGLAASLGTTALLWLIEVVV